jgi:hypothetical protein
MKFDLFGTEYDPSGAPDKRLSGHDYDLMRYKQSKLTHEYLKSILRYDPEKGIWVWLKRTRPQASKIKIGGIAGTLHQDGYRFISINGSQYKSSRLAFFYMTGRWPIEVWIMKITIHQMIDGRI